MSPTPNAYHLSALQVAMNMLQIAAYAQSLAVEHLRANTVNTGAIHFTAKAIADILNEM